LSTTLDHTAEQIVMWFVHRWTMEVTVEEARAHLGMETQRQWHDRTIARIIPRMAKIFIPKMAAHFLHSRWAGK